MCIVSRCRLLNGNCRMFDLAIVTVLVINDLWWSFWNIFLVIHIEHSYLLRVLFSKFEFPALISGFPINWTELTMGFAPLSQWFLISSFAKECCLIYEISYPYKCWSVKEKRNKRTFPFHKKTIGHSSPKKQINATLNWSTNCLNDIVQIFQKKKLWGTSARQKWGMFHRRL